MNILNLFFFICFSICVIGLVLHSFFTLYLKLAIRRKSAKKLPQCPDQADRELSFIHVIQLPVFNEDPEMVKGLIDSACDLDYPPEKLVIQLLDDSDSEPISTSIKQHIGQIQNNSANLQLLYLHRPDRVDYKAGNLNYGIGELERFLTKKNQWQPEAIIISIFDADYQIPVDYCKRIEPHFHLDNVGIVQTYTSFRNSDINDLTRAQTIFGDNLHLDEFSTRARTGHLSMFRGSAGSIRLSTLLESGCWQGDTQIEDVDLSFLAQCNGWKVIYDDTIISTSLLPESYNGYKLQQRSWMKGLMEVMRKRLGQIMASNNLSLAQKIIGADFFLILCLQAAFIIIGHLTLIPAYYFWTTFSNSAALNLVFILVLLFLVLTHIPFFVRETNNREKPAEPETTTNSSAVRTGLFAFGLMTAMFITLFYGCMEGLLGTTVHRDRTSKGNQDGAIEEAITIPVSSIVTLRRINFLELFMAIYSMGFIVWAFYAGEFLFAAAFSTLAIIYPLNYLLSAVILRKASTK